jgi:hypothetical protein
MGPFPPSKKCEYILVAVDYVSKWVEALPCKNADNINSKRMFEEIIFLRFGVPKIVIRNTSQHRYSLSPSNKWPGRNIQQANQEYSSKDSK